MNKKIGEDIYKKTKLKFHNKMYISSGKIQHEMQVPYATSAFLLDRLIEEGFASKAIDTRSVVLTGKNKQLKYFIGLSYCKLQAQQFNLKSRFRDMVFHLKGVKAAIAYQIKNGTMK